MESAGTQPLCHLHRLIVSSPTNPIPASCLSVHHSACSVFHHPPLHTCPEDPRAWKVTHYQLGCEEQGEGKNNSSKMVVCTVKECPTQALSPGAQREVEQGPLPEPRTSNVISLCIGERLLETSQGREKHGQAKEAHCPLCRWPEAPVPILHIFSPTQV